jgi:carboxypeptidase T
MPARCPCCSFICLPVCTDDDNQPVQVSPGRVNFQADCQPYTSYVNTPVGFISGSRAGFYTWPEMQARMDSMVHNYPTLCTKTTIGNTFLGVPIYVIKISDNAGTNEPNEPEVLFTGLHHAREGMSGMNLIFFMQYLLENYATNPQVKQLVDSRQMYFIPCVNVDGYNFNTTAANWNAGVFLRRKNMRNTGGTPASDGSGGYGIDLNRNYSKYFAYNNTGSSNTVSSDAYRGTAAFSEPETQNMRAFVNGRNFTLAVNYHCYGNWWIRPNGPAATATALATSDISIYTAMSNLFTKYNGFVYGNADQTVYEVNGYSDDWLFSDDLTLRKRVFAFSPEIGALSEGMTSPNNSQGFWAQTANIIPIAKKLLFSNFQIAYTAGGYGELQDNTDIDVNSTSGTFGFTVTRKGLIDTPITVTLVPIENIQTVGSPVTITSIPTFLGTQSSTISYTLPAGIPSGSRIRFVWKMDIGGITRTDTIIKFYSPTIAFSDDMETAANFSTKWTTSGTAAWSYTTTKPYSGTHSLNQSNGAAYAANADQSITLKSNLNLASSNTAYLSFWMRYDAENQNDKMQLEVSTTGTTGTFSPICGQSTIKETYNNMAGNPGYTGHADGWIHEVVDLSSYAGTTNTAIRFHFTSDADNSTEVSGTQSDDGFYLDNIKIVKSTLSLLPVTWVDFNAQKNASSVTLNWNVNAGAGFNHYDVQRSSNGVDFVSIASLSRDAAEVYTDETPLQGTNYYRMKAVDADGAYSYSKTILVTFDNIKNTISYYPNPARDFLNVVIPSNQNEGLIAELSSLSGQVVYSKTYSITEGSNRIQVDINNLTNGIYILKIKDSNNNTRSVMKVMKQ